MTPEYILRNSLKRKPHCDSNPDYVRRANEAIENLEWSKEYAEPGYTNPDKAILFANWNIFSNDATNLLEKYGYDIQWSDEWSTCGDCGKAVRTSPDSYGWQPSYVIMNDCEIVCIECLKDDPTDYLQSIEDNPKQALNLRGIDPSQHGYELIKGEFESGMHQGQNDKPEKIFAELVQAGHKRILFSVDTVGQFDMQFSVWKHIQEVTEQ